MASGPPLVQVIVQVDSSGGEPGDGSSLQPMRWRTCALRAEAVLPGRYFCGMIIFLPRNALAGGDTCNPLPGFVPS